MIQGWLRKGLWVPSTPMELLGLTRGALESVLEKGPCPSPLPWWHILEEVSTRSKCCWSSPVAAHCEEQCRAPWRLATLLLSYPHLFTETGARKPRQETERGPARDLFLSCPEIQRAPALWTSPFPCVNQSCEVACFADLVGRQRLET